MDYRKLLETLSNAGHDELLDNIDNAICAITNLLARAEAAEKERDEYKELFFSYKSVCGGIAPEKVNELVSADKDGRCFVSDVKLGGEVFYIPKFNGKPYCGIKTGHVQAVAFTKAGKRVKIREHHAHNQDFMIGKTVFLSPEAAEAAMKGEQDG